MLKKNRTPTTGHPFYEMPSQTTEEKYPLYYTRKIGVGLYM
jgi:hypothetical protein